MTEPFDAQRQVRRGLLWFGSATAIARVTNLASLLIILHTLESRQLGLASLVLGISIVFEAFAPFGVDTSIVQAKQISDAQYRSLQGFCLVFALVSVAALAGSAPAIARFYAEPELVPMLRVSGLKILVLAFTVVPLQRLLRELDFRRYSVVQTAASLGEDACKVVLVLGGLQAWALVFANIGRGVVLLVVLAAITRRWPRPALVWAEVRPHLSFGARASLGNAVMQSSNNIDYFIVGRLLGAERLGIYRVAYDLAATPMEMVARVVYRVAYPLFARLAADRVALRLTFDRMARTLLLGCGPLWIALSLGADDLLQLVSGEKWRAAAVAVPLLAAAGLWIAFERLLKQAFNALGRPELTLLTTLVGLVAVATALFAALRWVPAGVFGRGAGADLLGLGVAWLAASLPLWLLSLALAKRLFGLQVLAHLRFLLPAAGLVVASAISTFAVVGALSSVSAGIVAPLPRLAAIVGCCLLTYGLAFRWRSFRNR